MIKMPSITTKDNLRKIYNKMATLDERNAIDFKFWRKNLIFYKGSSEYYTRHNT